MEKRFDPTNFERAWQKRWAEGGYFEAQVASDKPSFCIMIPPPNVTGKLHIGHALQSTLQDLLVRWKRMLGFNALWLPGTDHAGIATQLMVERQLASEGQTREELGREAFLERMWQWKHEHEGDIHRQLDLLGASCDWSRETFTLDDGPSAAVRESFVRLYREGLITRGHYIVNWSPFLGTAISDLEVEMKEVRGKLYHIAYPVEGSDERIVVATTRPETMLGDTGVAMNPEDERYQYLLGRHAILPLVGRRIPFVADSFVDRDFGTGLVKVTPSHDPNDFEMGKRHNLPFVQVIDRRGKMSDAAGEEFAGLDRFEARKKVVAMLEGQGLLVRVEDHVHNVGHSQRGGEPIEPMVSEQWFCDVSSMAAKALEAVENGDLRLVPDSWNKTWAHWLSNIKPWCISRQLWWGHQIPAWYAPDGECFVAHSREEAVRLAGSDELTQDCDVLDTWFSSALWPFSTLGWPEETQDMETFYPTQVLVTGFDILFFWVARMVMTGLHYTGKVPFDTVHLTGLVRDAQGKKMSKTAGNTVDPVQLIDSYGADALRFTLAILDSPGRDIPLDLERMAGYRSFGNKIWNAVRFALSRIGEAKVSAEIDTDGLELPERWILSRLSKTAEAVNDGFETYRFDEACGRLYHFFWGELCDWYIELCKPALSGEMPRPRVGEVLLSVMDRSLRLLHPVMPHLTEEVWQRLPGREVIHPDTICLASFPLREEAWEDEASERSADQVMEIIGRARALRSELKIPARTGMRLWLDPESKAERDVLAKQAGLIAFLGRMESVEMGKAPEGSIQDRVAGVPIAMVVDKVEMGEEELQRLQKELAEVEAAIERTSGLLANESFLAKAPEAIVQKNRDQVLELERRRERIRNGLEQG